MANPEHLEILKQGVSVWNRWREKNRDVRPDLKNADLSGKPFKNHNLSNVDLDKASFKNSSLNWVDFHGASLRDTDFSPAFISYSLLAIADLTNSDFTGSQIQFSDFTFSQLIHVDFNQALLTHSKFQSLSLNGTNFKDAIVSDMIFSDVDFRDSKGLKEIRHTGKSYIDFSTIISSKGNIPEAFLRGCGVPDNFIEYIESLSGAALEYHTCFISYSSKDQNFAERLYVDLQKKGVRCWYAPEDMKIGDKIRDRIDQSIRVHDKLLLILSEHSINSEWVEDEVEAAYEQEQKRKTTVLFPIRLDDAVMDTEKAWAAKLRRSRHIGDFTNWKDHDSYQNAFERLLNNLKAERE